MKKRGKMKTKLPTFSIIFIIFLSLSEVVNLLFFISFKFKAPNSANSISFSFAEQLNEGTINGFSLHLFNV